MTNPPAPAADAESQLASEATTYCRKARPLNLQWDDLTYSIELGRGKPRRRVVNQANGELSPGELCCIIGPSGAGKSSLLNTLSGRVASSSSSKHNVSGCVMLNGAAIDPARHRSTIAYVMQEDALVGTATPREALRFSADLRLGPGPSVAERVKLVDGMLATLTLNKVADSMIGNELIRGVSGGEKKRTAIGVELITQPGLLFLDEPTSGLDSFSAFNVAKVLQGLARAGCSILCTIHQPSSEIFHLFDSVIFMENGDIVYAGRVADVAAVFDCPGFNNPADHVMYMLQTDVPKMKELRERSERAGAEGGAPRGGSGEGAAGLERGPRSVRSVPAVEPATEVAPRTAGFWTQLRCLVVREQRDLVRDKAALVGRFFITGFLSAILACIFYRVGDRAKASYELSSHFGALAILAINGMFQSAQPMLLKFPSERPIFLREYATGTVDPAPYFMSKVMLEIPLALATSVEQWLIVYWAMGFSGNFFYFVLMSFVITLVSASTAMLMGCVLSDVKKAIEAAPVCFVPQIFFSGFFIRIEQIPVWLRWCQYLCSLKYTLNTFMIIEFGDCPGMDGAGQTWQSQCDQLLEANDVDKDQWWVYLSVLIALFVGYRMLAMFALKRKAKTVYSAA